ncbi:MAG TPA: ribonuclease E/G [Lachnospiraceae bacterium]|nr:ribonuclease E/G [Lachnospiraceae bacterium]
MIHSSFVITHYKNGIISALIKDNKLEHINYFDIENNDLAVGNIFIGKVSNVVKNMNAAFVEVKPGINCFLPIDSTLNPKLLNRIFDGRLIAGDELLVQINREAIKTKDPLITTNISISGQYSVCTYGNRKIGFSSKLSKSNKELVKTYLQEECSSLQIQNKNGVLKSKEEFGIVIRTNVSTLLPDHLDLLNDELAKLKDQLVHLIDIASKRTCFSKLVEAPPKYLELLKNLYESNYDKVVTDSKSIFDSCKQYLEENNKESLTKLSFYQDEKLPLFNLYGLDSKISEALNKKVWLKSGGYLVIEPTEALIVIDVNSGKFSGKVSKADAIFQINMEAAEEMAHQLKLRNLSGIIIVDFINMDNPLYKEQLINKIRELIKKDSIKTDFIDITPLGLVEITRKKVEKSLKEQLNLSSN